MDLEKLKKYFSESSNPYKILDEEKRFIANIPLNSVEKKVKVRYLLFEATIEKKSDSFEKFKKKVEFVETEELLKFFFLIFSVDVDLRGCQKAYIKMLHLMYNYFEECATNKIEDDYCKILNKLCSSSDTQIKIEAACILSKGIKYKPESKEVIVEYLKDGFPDRKILKSIFETYKDKMQRRENFSAIKSKAAPISITEYDYVIMKSMKEHTQVARHYVEVCRVKWKEMYNTNYHEILKQKIENGTELSAQEQWVVKTYDICLSMMSSFECVDIINKYIITDEWNQDHNQFQMFFISVFRNIVEFIMKRIPNMSQLAEMDIDFIKDENLKNSIQHLYNTWKGKEDKIEQQFYTGFFLTVCGVPDNKRQIIKVINDHWEDETIYGLELKNLKDFFQLDSKKEEIDEKLKEHTEQFNKQLSDLRTQFELKITQLKEELDKVKAENAAMEKRLSVVEKKK